MLYTARGTFEPGPFGLIVGDPLMAAVRAKVPASRGYAVHVRAISSQIHMRRSTDIYSSHFSTLPTHQQLQRVME
jgi:hypothetical protein